MQVVNKKAKFNYELIEQFEAGMILHGTEVKSIKAGKVSIQEAYCFLQKGRLFIKGMNVTEYDYGNINNHKPARIRELLLNKRELKKLEDKIKDKGLTIVPIRLFLSDRSLIKLDIGLARGKKNFDKRNSIKQKEQQRDIDRLKKMY